MEPLRQWLSVFLPSERIFVGYLLSSLLLAWIAYIILKRSAAEEKPDLSKGFLAYVFDRDAYLHKSALQDYFFFITNAVIFYALIAQFLVGQHVFSTIGFKLAEEFFGPPQQALLDSHWDIAAFTLTSVLVIDFAIFIVHYFFHFNPIMWHFHAVHHSAEVLNPMTLHRMHPVDLALTFLAVSFLGGTAVGLLMYLQNTQPNEVRIFGLNVVIFLFYLFGYNLRHSQVWLSYPEWLSHIFISPAQHQVHHSTAEKHRDKNFGLIFSFWDKLFGTLYVPKGYEKLDYGINVSERNPFKSVTDLYILPFRHAFKALRKEKKEYLLFPFVLIAIALMGQYLYSQIKVPSVHLEEMTWNEIHKAQTQGYDTILIPTGGTEQNGTHVVLGKHNYIVRKTSEEIALNIGQALVAPVMAYVPEGERHMAFPGTINVPDKIFEDVLTATTESMIHHGFKYIFFIGDSFDNQTPQEKAAQTLMRKWSKEGIVVASIGDYYKNNKQTEWLRTKGHSDTDIGQHAGMRDTSELIYVHPDGVRKTPSAPPDGYPSGHNGNRRKAGWGIGKKMIELKVKAATEEIKKLRPRAMDALSQQSEGTRIY